MYELQMDFDVINGGSQGFMIMGNGEIYGSYDYTKLPVTIGPLQTDGSTPYHFIARDKEAPVYGNWDKLIPFTCESLGLEEPISNQELVNVYPNPSYGSVTFENPEQGNCTVIVYNSSGAILKTFSFKGTYKLDDLSSGMYFYRVMDEDGNISSGKLVVNR